MRKLETVFILLSDNRSTVCETHLQDVLDSNNLLVEIMILSLGTEYDRPNVKVDITGLTWFPRGEDFVIIWRHSYDEHRFELRVPFPNTDKHVYQGLTET